jgi:double-stranded uracil-DNA glycosylase
MAGSLAGIIRENRSGRQVVADKLPDVLVPGLRVLFCGSAAGQVSAERGAYYAGPGNRFWTILAATGLTPRCLAPDEFPLLPQFAIGLTDLAKSVSGADASLPHHAFDREALRRRIHAVRPKVLAFNGKKAASVFLSRPGPQLCYGRQSPLEDFPEIYVLPSTSGAARGVWDQRPWFDLAAALR